MALVSCGSRQNFLFVTEHWHLVFNCCPGLTLSGSCGTVAKAYQENELIISEEAFRSQLLSTRIKAHSYTCGDLFYKSLTKSGTHIFF